jgi:apolipoprotein N-acyltransferase
MHRIAQAVILSWGWRRIAVAFAAGALSALSQAPLHLAPVLFLTLPVLVWLIDGAAAPGRRGLAGLGPAAAVGWWFGFGYFLAGLWWIGAAFLVDAAAFGWMMPIAVVLLPAGLALFTAAGIALARLVWVEGPLRVFALALGLGLSELARSVLFTGCPWNLLGQAVAFTDVTAQAAAVVGVHGLTALAPVVFAAPAILADETGRHGRARVFVAGFAALLVAAGVGYGTARLAVADTAGGSAGPRVRIVQPAIDQYRKWDPQSRLETVETLIALSETKTDDETLGAMSFALIVWPETALPFFLTEQPEALARIGAMVPPGTVLVTGAPRAEPGPDGRRYYNSVYVVGDGGRILDAYDKVHLVPFGEYLPLEPVFSAIGLSMLAEGVGGFSAGPGPKTVALPAGLPAAGLLVCYEIIFPGRATTPGERPGFLVNLTNDAWFGRTPGPYQHLDLARVRAIEEGLPVVRAANTGISTIIDPYGRMPETLGLDLRGVLDGTLPAALPPTTFSALGSFFLLTIYGFHVTVLAAGGRRWVRIRS